MPLDPTPELILAIEPGSTPLAAAIDNSEGIYVFPPEKMPPARPKGIVIGVPAVARLRPKKRRMSPFRGD